MTTYETYQDMYIICEGTSINDVIDSVNASSTASGTASGTASSWFTFSTPISSKKISLEEYPKIEDIGIKEMHMCKENSKVHTILNDEIIPGINPEVNIYTSLNYNAIESGLILLSSLDNSINKTIYPLPYMSSDTNIKTKKDLDIFKKKFGTIKNNVNTNITRYWEEKNLNTQFLNINLRNKINKSINWSEINKINILNSYNFVSFKKSFENLYLEYFKTIRLFRLNEKNNYNLIFICSPKLIADILKLIKNIKYNKKTDIIERSSVWKISMKIEPKYDTSGNLNKNNTKFIYDSFTKIYPTEYNHDKLEYRNNIYSFNYNNSKFVLFNALESIPVKYIKNMSLFRMLSDKRNNILKLIEENKNKNKNTNTKLINKSSSSIENIIDKYTRN